MWARSMWRECCLPPMGLRFGWFGPGMRRRPSRQDLIRWLEEYQKDLEQELADVAEELKRLKEEKTA
jgi:hypothetical protein